MIRFGSSWIQSAVAFAATATAVHGPWPTALAAESIHRLPVGTVVTGVAQLGERQVPLLPGPWTLVAKEQRLSSGSANGVPLAYVYLAQVEAGVVVRWIFAGTNLEAVSGGWTRDKNVCDRMDTHFAYSDRNYSTTDADCWIVNHNGMTLGSNPWQVHSDFYRYTDDKRRPSTALSIDFFLVRTSSYLRVSYLFNPEASGFDRTPTSAWRGNPWHKDHVPDDPKKLSYIRDIRKEADRLSPLLRDGLRGRLQDSQMTVRPVDASARPAPSNAGLPPPDAVERLKQLQSLLDQKLITQDEYATRRQRILDGL